jgi:outer membrane receptor protein involved in Fe transport
MAETSTLALAMALTLEATAACAQDYSQGAIELPAVEVTAESQTPNASTTTTSAGTGAPTDSNEAASAFTVTGAQVNDRIFSRPGEVLEIVPGLIATQHSGDGKANQ